MVPPVAYLASETSCWLDSVISVSVCIALSGPSHAPSATPLRSFHLLQILLRTPPGSKLTNNLWRLTKQPNQAMAAMHVESTFDPSPIADYDSASYQKNTHMTSRKPSSSDYFSVHLE